MKLIVASLTRMFTDDDATAAAQERVAGGVRRWQDDLNAALKPHLEAPLSWDEDQEQRRSLDLPAVAHRALLLLAAYAQKTDLSWPDDVPPRVDTDPAWQQISAGNFARCQYPQVVIPSFWVPGDFTLTMQHALPDGEEIVLGSLEGLATQLRVLNHNALQMSSAAVEDRLRPSVEVHAKGSAEFVFQAAYGLAVLSKAADAARALSVPVRLLQTA